MKLDTILSGVGGQGILSIATIIGEAALNEGLHIKQSEVHGMSQRGGEVQSHLRISSDIIHSDLISQKSADAIISLEPMEALRYTSYLAPEAWVVSNSAPFVNIPNYPDIKVVIDELSALPRVILINIDSLAKEAGSLRTANMLLLGAASPILKIEQSKLEDAIDRVFSRKGKEVVEMNIKAFRIGREAGMAQIQQA